MTAAAAVAAAVLVIPYTNSDPVTIGFDNEMCKNTDSMRILLEDLERFEKTGRLR